MSASARYTYIPAHDSMSGLMDAVNEFCRKYPEYRLFQVILDSQSQKVFAVLTTDPN